MSVFKLTFTFDTQDEVIKAETFFHPKPYDAVRIELNNGTSILCKSRQDYHKALERYSPRITELIQENALLDVLDAE